MKTSDVLFVVGVVIIPAALAVLGSWPRSTTCTAGAGTQLLHQGNCPLWVFGLNFQIEYMTPEDAKDEIAQCKEQLQQP